MTSNRLKKPQINDEYLIALARKLIEEDRKISLEKDEEASREKALERFNELIESIERKDMFDFDRIESRYGGEDILAYISVYLPERLERLRQISEEMKQLNENIPIPTFAKYREFYDSLVKWRKNPS